MKKLLLTICLLISTSSIMAYTVKCTGTDSAGYSIYFIGDSNSLTVNINGDILSIVGKTRNNQGVVTQQFINVFGTLVYDSIVPINNNSLTLYQFNAVTQALLAQAWLSCSFYGANASTANIINHPMFNSIKANSMKSTGGMPFNKIEQSNDEK